MITVQVAIPVWRGRRRFIVRKGRRWSVIEHLLLEAAAKIPRTAREFHELSGLPRRVIVEAFIRLMRVGWAEMALTADGPQFRATAIGAALASYEQLPVPETEEQPFRGFIIERVTGCVFRSRELATLYQAQIPKSDGDNIVIQLPAENMEAVEDLEQIFSALEFEDERIVRVVPRPESFLNQYAVVSVSDAGIEGLPRRAGARLRGVILSRALEALKQRGKTFRDETLSAQAIAATASTSPRTMLKPLPRTALFEPNDLIVDGQEHLASIEAIAKHARRRIILHSGFINRTGFHVVPKLIQAASNGVHIDILWGQNEEPGATASSRVEAGKIEEMIARAGRSDSIVIHPFSTGSHSKIIVADDGKGQWFAVVGSCNWLASSLKSFDASIRLREPAFVAELLDKLAMMSLGRRMGIWHDFASDLVTLGREIRAGPSINGRRVPMRLLLASDHAELALEAKDRARRRMFIASHQFGLTAKPMVLFPAITAAEQNNVSTSVFYGKTATTFSGESAADLTRQLEKQGIRIRPVHHPRIHAKIFAWDDDALALTSLNWLSGDPSESSPLSEIGVFLESSRAADTMIRRFEHALSSSEANSGPQRHRRRRG